MENAEVAEEAEAEAEGGEEEEEEEEDGEYGPQASDASGYSAEAELSLLEDTAAGGTQTQSQPDD